MQNREQPSMALNGEKQEWEEQDLGPRKGVGEGLWTRKSHLPTWALITNDFISPILMCKTLMRERLAALKITHSSCSSL